MQKVKAAMIGTGFMGKVHTEAARRLGFVDVVAVAGSSDKTAAAFGESVGIERTTGDYRSLLADPDIHAVHVCTPNVMHYGVSKEALEAGKHVVCEKPMTMSVAEAESLVEVANRTGLANCVEHNLRYYPVVQQIRQMVAAGELGDILVVQGTYSQDWLLYDTDYNWRIERPANGPLRVMGDIGSHWMDMIQHLTGLPITSLCADLQTFHKTRRKPKVSIQTFAGKTLQPSDYDEVPIDTDDYGAVLLRLGDRARGAFTVSQVSAGCKNRFVVEIYGTKSGVRWDQERPDELFIGQRNSPSQLLLKDPGLLTGEASGFADLPGGHSEGYDDTHKQILRRFYRKVLDPTAPVDYPTFADGLIGMKLLEKVTESHEKRGWVETGL